MFWGKLNGKRNTRERKILTPHKKHTHKKNKKQNPVRWVTVNLYVCVLPSVCREILLNAPPARQTSGHHLLLSVLSQKLFRVHQTTHPGAARRNGVYVIQMNPSCNCWEWWRYAACSGSPQVTQIKVASGLIRTSLFFLFFFSFFLPLKKQLLHPGLRMATTTSNCI